MAIKVGGTTVVDDSRQLTNIASVDATTVAALGAAGVGGGGGSFDATASANITAGDPVVLNSNGTISPVTTTAAFSNSIEVGVDTAVSYRTKDIYYQKTHGYAVCAYIDEGNGDYYATTIKDNTHTKQSHTVATYNFGVKQPHMAYDPVEETFVFLFDNSSDNYKTAQMNSSGQLTITEEVTLPFALGGDPEMCSCYDPDSGKLIFIWRNSTDSNYVNYVVGTCSGNSISWGTRGTVSNTVIGTGAPGEPSAVVYDETANRVLFCWRNNSSGNTNSTSAIAGSVSGNTITWGSAVQVDSNANYALSLVYDPISGKNLLAYGDGSENVYVRVLSLSGSTISVGAESSIQTFYAKYTSSYYNEATQEINLIYSDDNNYAAVKSGTISGTTATFGSQFGISTGREQNIMSTYNSNLARGYSFHTNASANDKTDLYIFETASNDAAGFIGLAAETITSGSTGEVTLIGGVNESQTGLTVNDRLYVSVGGGLTTADTGTAVGRAISTTSVVVTGGA